MGSPRAAVLLMGVGLLGALDAIPARGAESSIEITGLESASAISPGEAAIEETNSGTGAELWSTEAAVGEKTPDPAPAVETVSPEPPSDAALPRDAAPPNDTAQNAGASKAAPPSIPSANGADVAASVPSQDPVAAALTTLLTSGGQLHPRLAPKEKEALLAFYALGDFKPIWIKDRAWTAPARAIIARLKAADQDALDPAAYAVPALGVTANGDSPADLAESDLKLSVAAVLYARDARGARIEPSRLSRLITPKLDLPAADAVLTTLASASDPGAALEAYNPRHAGYQALKRKLAEVRANRPGPPMAGVTQGPALKIGMRDPRVPLIRARFQLGPIPDETAYDERLASAVASFQRQKGLPPSGVLTPQTVAALGGASPARIEGDLIANMERWRWLPADLGREHIAVNIPEFRLQVWKDGAPIHQTRVVVGKPETPTPVFSGVMEYAIVNPSWNVPPSILKNEFLPRMAADPFYAAKRGYEVIHRNGQIFVRQPPGERNALGFIKFMFPNQHAVYLHDTPSRHLFSAERRAFSHGCVRVDQPFRLADVVLGAAWSESRLRSLIGRGERTITLPERLPVHLTYFTTTVDERGTVRSIEDLYGINRRVRAALGFGG